EQREAGAGRELRGRLEHRLERSRLVRVVDDDGEGLAFVDEIEPARYAFDSLDAALDPGLVDTERAGRGCRGECVLNVEPSTELELDVAQLALGPERDRAGKLGRQPHAVPVADVDDGMRGLREQPALRLEVLLHCAVEVQVIL